MIRFVLKPIDFKGLLLTGANYRKISTAQMKDFYLTESQNFVNDTRGSWVTRIELVVNCWTPPFLKSVS